VKQFTMIHTLRPDERTAWNGFRAAAPRFAREEIAGAGDGPDPPDVICASASGKTIGVELTRWVEHDQITNGRGREFFENSYLKIIASENEPRPDRIGWVWLHDKSQRIKPEDEMPFRNELFELLSKRKCCARAESRHMARSADARAIVEHAARGSSQRIQFIPDA
jgi:hypothetical protein